MGEERYAWGLVKALDTNVVLRLLVADDPVQGPIAEREFNRPVLLTLTVILETACVLRSRYRFSRMQVAALLGALIDRSTVTVEAPDRLAWALGRYAQSGDLADLIHLVAARSATSFATFDRGVAPTAGDDSPLPIETLD